MLPYQDCEFIGIPSKKIPNISRALCHQDTKNLINRTFVYIVIHSQTSMFKRPVFLSPTFLWSSVPGDLCFKTCVLYVLYIAGFYSILNRLMFIILYISRPFFRIGLYVFREQYSQTPSVLMVLFFLVTCNMFSVNSVFNTICSQCHKIRGPRVLMCHMCQGFHAVCVKGSMFLGTYFIFSKSK